MKLVEQSQEQSVEQSQQQSVEGTLESSAFNQSAEDQLDFHARLVDLMPDTRLLMYVASEKCILQGQRQETT